MMVNSIYFYFILYLYLYFIYFLVFELKVRSWHDIIYNCHKLSQVTVTQSRITKNIVKGSRIIVSSHILMTNSMHGF